MFETLFDHIKNHRVGYSVGAVLLLVLVSLFSYYRVPGAGYDAEGLTGSVRLSRPSTKATDLKPSADLPSKELPAKEQPTDFRPVIDLSVCTESDWSCTDFEPSECPTSGQTTRTCTLTTKCVDTDNVKPAETAVCTPLACANPPNGLIGWWPGDRNANDIVGVSHAKTGGGLTFASGKVHQAFSFDGDHSDPSFVLIADDPRFTSSVITIDAWVNKYDPPGIVNVIAAKEGSWKLSMFGDGTLRFSVDADGDTLGSTAFDVVVTTSNTVITPGAFHHVTASYDGAGTSGYLKIYVNGNMVAEKRVPAFSIFDSNTPVVFGTHFVNDVPAPNAWEGLIDEIGIYDRALAQTEIQAIFDAGHTGKCKVGL